MKFLNRDKEYDYFTNFCKVGDIACQSADYLQKSIVNFDYDKVSYYTSEMHKMENYADEKKHELCNHLAHEFMPPIDREDISLLAQKLDNIVDAVEDVMRKIYMFNIKKIRPEAIDFVNLVSESCKIFKDLINEFSNFRKSKTLKNYIIEINTLENKGDSLHADSIRHLFSENISATEQLSWTEIFDSFEKALDSCEDAADIIDSVITKNT